MRALLLGLMFVAVPAMAAAASAQNPPPSPETPLSVWEPGEGGALTHLQSGLVCPSGAEGYSRTAAVLFNPFGLDVGCSYELGPTTITLYLTRRGGEGVDAAMVEAKRQLQEFGAQRHPQMLSETRTAQGGLDWTVALYAVDGGEHTGIWVADLAGWTLKYRATYPQGDDARIAANLKSLTASVQASAGARLRLCAKSPTPRREGKAIKNRRDVEQASMMSSLLGGALMAAAQDKEAAKDSELEASIPLIWCVEQPIQKEGRNMLFWRAVTPDGQDAQSDQVTLMTLDRPLSLLMAQDSLAALIDDNPKKPPRWTASLAVEDNVAIYGMFNGRPPVESATDLFVNVVSGKAKPLGGYGAKGNSITINVPGN